jgi:hypothetical protein
LRAEVEGDEVGFNSYYPVKSRIFALALSSISTLLEVTFDIVLVLKRRELTGFV